MENTSAASTFEALLRMGAIAHHYSKPLLWLSSDSELHLPSVY